MQLTDLQGVGRVRQQAMHVAGISSLRDLLYVVPYRYRDANKCLSICDAHAGEMGCFSLRRVGAPILTRYGKTSRISCLFEDDNGEISACWFNQPWMKDHLLKKTHYLLYGKVERYAGRLQLVNPSVESELRIVPIYRPIEGLSQKTHENIVKQALEEVEKICPENLPSSVVHEHGLLSCAEAIRILHAPDSMQKLEKAKRRFAFEQMLLYQTAVRMVKDFRRRGIPMEAGDLQQLSYWHSLSFIPTEAQRRTLCEIACDMSGQNAMARMVQGDVGCGKTAIAFGAMMLCVRSGYQAALMAPTEILARQHYKIAKQYFESQGITCGLLVGGMPTAERRQALTHLRDGAWQVVIGTHALIGKGVHYRKLGLCVTDEQHRFGVRQRTALLDKGMDGEGADARDPHLLVMSATPIPRSLALIIFGDLNISIVDELPPGRLPVTTRIVLECKREGMYAFLRNEVRKGRQAYIVCPLVEESDASDTLKAVTTHVQMLKKGPLKGIAVGVTHGRQPPEEKEEAIRSFADGKTKVLIATTVIEVGINVPNATLMIIEDADRYGLAQLHQLRGRVGRGCEQSWCFLLAKPNERLRALTETNDGFEIARKDLELRGPGEILGTQQHGMGGIYGSLLFRDTPLLYEASACAEVLQKDKERKEDWEKIKVQAARYFENASHSISIS